MAGTGVRRSQRKLASESPGQTLDATALVHEAYFNPIGGVVMADLKGKPYSIHVYHGLEWVDLADGNADLEVGGRVAKEDRERRAAKREWC